MSGADNAAAWGLPGVLDFFAGHRDRTSEVYPSEWFFLQESLTEGMSVLDVGCAQGGFAAVIAEHVRGFSYTGLDVNAEMVGRARARFPQHTFHHIEEADFSPLGEARFDVVLVLGILHLHEAWRATIRAAWRHTAHRLILDLREWEGETIEDKAVSYMAMDFAGGGADHAEARVPYIVLNAGDALGQVLALAPGAAAIARYGYLHAPSATAVTPAPRIMTTCYRIDRR